MFISSVAALQKRELPIGLVLCGLPTLTGNLLKARSYTERMFRGEEIASLTGDDAREAFTQPLANGGDITANDELVEAVTSEVEGYLPERTSIAGSTSTRPRPTTPAGRLEAE